MRENLATVTQERDNMKMVQEESIRVMTVTGIARDLGFADPSDAVMMINDQLDDLVTADGEVDPDAVENELNLLLESKPYLKAEAVVAAETKKKKAVKEAAKVTNPPSENEAQIQKASADKSEDEKAVDEQIRKANQRGNGRQGFRLWLNKKYLPNRDKSGVKNTFTMS